MTDSLTGRAISSETVLSLMAGTFPVKSSMSTGKFPRAQDQPKSVKTARIREPAPGSPNLTMIDEDARCGSTGTPSKRSQRRKPIVPSYRWHN
jgi:hypothetical protein